jgi:hypothetical protein
MSMWARLVDATAAAFCSHEWTSRHDPGRWYLECVKCGTLTPGIEVGRRASEAAARSQEARRPLLAFSKASRAA